MKKLLLLTALCICCPEIMLAVGKQSARKPARQSAPQHHQRRNEQQKIADRPEHKPASLQASQKARAEEVKMQAQQEAVAQTVPHEERVKISRARLREIAESIETILSESDAYGATREARMNLFAAINADSIEPFLYWLGVISTEMKNMKKTAAEDQIRFFDLGDL